MVLFRKRITVPSTILVSLEQRSVYKTVNQFLSFSLMSSTWTPTATKFSGPDRRNKFSNFWCFSVGQCSLHNRHYEAKSWLSGVICGQWYCFVREGSSYSLMYPRPVRPYFTNCSAFCKMSWSVTVKLYLFVKDMYEHWKRLRGILGNHSFWWPWHENCFKDNCVKNLF